MSRLAWQASSLGAFKTHPAASVESARGVLRQNVDRPPGLPFRVRPAYREGLIWAMGNPYGITLDDASLRWAAAEGVSESVIAAICLLGEMSVDEIVARLFRRAETGAGRKHHRKVPELLPTGRVCRP